MARFAGLQFLAMQLILQMTGGVADGLGLADKLAALAADGVAMLQSGKGNGG